MEWIVESIGKWGVNATNSAKRLTTPKPGDVIDFGEFEGIYPFTHGKYGRIWTTIESSSWGNSMCCEMGSAFLFENGHVDISGGPFAGFETRDLEETYTLRNGEFWNWGMNLPGGGMGIYYTIARPVFRLRTYKGKTAAELRREQEERTK